MPPGSRKRGLEVTKALWAIIDHASVAPAPPVTGLYRNLELIPEEPNKDNGSFTKYDRDRLVSPRRKDVKLKGNFGWARPILINRIVVRDEVMLKQNFGWAWSLWAGAPGLIYGIVIRDVQYQFEVNRCRNEEVYVK
ncbi:hypothetical protein DPMN_133681 [Dreissena polymorpha]|uniref:Uncharacterized protein n=1 Tax=Dreissena polymorpha TaxID=45954 RepID=A0A9D4FYD2_DREPO|nr:hypothetical protein DPMN_133681 [Dreissena polymorpha]